MRKEYFEKCQGTTRSHLKVKLDAFRALFDCQGEMKVWTRTEVGKVVLLGRNYVRVVIEGYPPYLDKWLPREIEAFEIKEKTG